MKSVSIALLCALGAVACDKDNSASRNVSTTSATQQGTSETTGATVSAGTATSMPPNGANGATGATGASTATGLAADQTNQADNTKINDRDRHGGLTPTDQGKGNDRDITAAVRRAIVGDKSLSFTAKNVKIITVNGKVTLRGPVKSDEEKSAIEAKARSAPSVAEVDNQLEVKK